MFSVKLSQPSFDHIVQAEMGIPAVSALDTEDVESSNKIQVVGVEHTVLCRSDG